MSAVLIPRPSVGLQRARQVVAHPNFHTEGAVLDACEQLEASGDWVDGQRARELRKVVVQDAVAEINRRDRWGRVARCTGLILGALTVLVLLIGQVL